MTGYRPKHFKIEELVPRAQYNALDGSVLWNLLDPRILRAADSLRDRYGAMLCNTWLFGGDTQYRGWRPQVSVGARYSQHRFGRALDLIPKHATAEEIRVDLRHFYKGRDPLDGRNHITRVELNVDWLHIDCANIWPGDTIYFFHP